MIVTLAGHVDHGKTTLVRALTGVDTDRLAEEKARGLTIDLGFAYTDDLGFVDVPGHQKFIHNMVAGVASQQHALLVIAADDGPMPQSREHLEILSVLGLRQGTVALTKCDLVSTERLAACRAEIATLTQNTFLQHADIFQTSAQQPDGYASLKTHLRQIAAGHQPTADQAEFRMAIDRAFTVKGAGVVVTGTVHCGAIALDQPLCHFPSNKALRVRSLRVQDAAAESACTGDRCALNLVGLSLDELKRGDWISSIATQGHHSVTIKLDKASSFPRALKHWMPVHIYHATSHSTGRLALFTDAPNGETWGEVICDVPMRCHRGDRLVLRDQALDATLGGGEVLYSQLHQAPRRNSAAHKTLVAGYAATGVEASFAALMDLGELRLSQFSRIWNLAADRLGALQHQHNVRVVDDLAVSEQQWLDYEQQALTQLTAAAEQSPQQGLRAQDLTTIPGTLRQNVANALVKSGAAEQAAGLYLVANAQPELPAELASLWAQVEPALDHLQAPSSGDLAKLLSMHLPQLERQLVALAKRGMLTHLGGHRFYLPTRLAEIAAIVQTMAAADPASSFTVKAFRDETGIGRNVAIEVLEFFDSKGFTKRSGNDRIVLRPFA